jgi:hypothetical protein
MALGEATGVEMDQTEEFLAAGERIRSELLAVAHEPRAERAHEIDRSEMNSWLRYAKTFIRKSRPNIALATAILAAEAGQQGQGADEGTA